LSLLKPKFDVTVLSEIRSNNIDSYKNIIEGYSFYCEIPTNIHVGCVEIYINNAFKHVILTEFKLIANAKDRVEYIWLEVSNSSSTYIVSGINRHPNTSITELQQLLDTVLGKVYHRNLPCIVAGNTNIDLMKCEK
jgi:hypothetical protein